MQLMKSKDQELNNSFPQIQMPLKDQDNCKNNNFEHNCSKLHSKSNNFITFREFETSKLNCKILLTTIHLKELEHKSNNFSSIFKGH